MKRTPVTVIGFGILFLFFIQMAGTLVESIYILDLMHTSLDAKALGVLFFFSPILLFPFRRKFPKLLIWSLIGLLFLSRGVTPYLDTLGRMLASGIGIGTVLLICPFLVTAKMEGNSTPHMALWASAGLGLALSASVLLRTLNYGIDYSLTASGGWVGWALGAAFVLLFTQLEWNQETGAPKRKKGLTRAVMGIFLILTLAYFAFSAPVVIARWTEGNYALIVLVISLFATGWAWIAIHRPRLIESVSTRLLVIWNLAFTLSLVGTILAHRVPFPPTPESPAVIIGTPTWVSQLPLYFMLVLFPVIFLDLYRFTSRIRQLDASPGELIPGMLAGSAILIVLVFINIFTNVWGYIPPVSSIFRNLFWLPFLLVAGGITLLTIEKSKAEVATIRTTEGIHVGLTVLLGIFFLGTGISALRPIRMQAVDMGKSSLSVMTYNIQAANDSSGERSYERQLALIRQVSPDIVVLQETDTTRISLNNNDYVRYYADKLGYYSYYGPTTVTGTFGTAILSKYPLFNTQSIFSYSDQDEIGTAKAEIDVGGKRFTIFDVHPDGSDTAKMVWAQTLLAQAKDKPNVIALGDYNLRDYEAPYQLIASIYANAWESVYPSKISLDGTDMSGKNRIDHIFISPSLGVRNPVYILPPASATDHPVHWAEIFWGN
jgi:endonuclease/exonuclease/phosphatase family metal-dependent hydrolase